MKSKKMLVLNTLLKASFAITFVITLASTYRGW